MKRPICNIDKSNVGADNRSHLRSYQYTPPYKLGLSGGTGAILGIF